MESCPHSRASPSIEDYALIGDCRSAALVSRQGGIDWLCWPRFDSTPLFALLLDRPEGGSWTIGPATTPRRVKRRYLPGTAVLETLFLTDHGTLVVQDFMPVATKEELTRELRPERQILRRVECREGHVDVELRYAPRPDFGRRLVRLEDRDEWGVLLPLREGVLGFATTLSYATGNRTATGCTRLRQGEVHWCSLSFSGHGPAYLEPLGETAERRLVETTRWWKEWTDRIVGGGRHVGMVRRSAVALKLLTYAPSGAVVAAPTASLPESIGGARNWDYRYCWLRDAAMTVRALYALGCREEGDAFTGWILHATRRTWPEVRVMYDVHGNPVPREREIPSLSGFRDSRPVRIGNGAREQLQLDVYGEVVGAVAEYADRGGTADRTAKRFLRGIAQTVCRRWVEPDHGIWEPRSGPRHNTYSKVRCWSALDRLLRLDEAWSLRLPRQRLTHERSRIRETVEREAWNADIGSYTSCFGGEDVDASLLLMAEHGYVGPDNAHRYAATVRAVGERLGTGALVMRYRDADGIDGPEGAFAACAFWNVLAHVALGETERARTDLEQLLDHANDVGLYAEEIDPETGAALGSFPQAFTHVGLIQAVLALERVGGEPS